jgi:hypothetical protein
MSIDFSATRIKKSKTRRFQYLPRLGFTVELGGNKFTYKQVPVIETFFNLKGKKITWENIKRVAEIELNEIKISPISARKNTVKTKK